MPKRKVKRNARRSKAHCSFKVCREPVVDLRAHTSSRDMGDNIGLRHVRGNAFLFAIARDAGTIFVTWNIDWQRIFQRTTPADRQVHLRVIGDDGVERTRVAVEPMTTVHYVATPGLPECSRVEIGFFEPMDTWHSVAISSKIEIPRQGMAESGDVDLATIPFHLSFEQLAHVFGAPKDAPLASVVSQFQKRVITQPNEAAPADTQIMGKLNLSRADIAAAQREFQNINTEKLARRTRAARLQSIASSPSRGFEGNP